MIRKLFLYNLNRYFSNDDKLERSSELIINDQMSLDMVKNLQRDGDTYIFMP